MATDWGVISATVVGPILAVQAQKYLERNRERKRAKSDIFKMLMATRAATLSHTHVQALNMIELEFTQDVWYEWFSKSKSKRVLEAWRAYHNHLGIQVDHTNQYQSTTWNERKVELLIDMLHQMAVCLNYPFDRTQIRNSWYAPIAYDRAEGEDRAIRSGLAEILSGRRGLPISNHYATDEGLRQAMETQRLLKEWLDGGRAVPIMVHESNESPRRASG